VQSCLDPYFSAQVRCGISATGRADEDGLPCYLECNGSRNRAIYMRYGFIYGVGKYTFEVEGDEPGSAPFTEAFAMWRPPM